MFNVHSYLISKLSIAKKRKLFLKSLQRINRYYDARLSDGDILLDASDAESYELVRNILLIVPNDWTEYNPNLSDRVLSFVIPQRLGLQVGNSLLRDDKSALAHVIKRDLKALQDLGWR